MCRQPHGIACTVLCLSMCRQPKGHYLFMCRQPHDIEYTVLCPCADSLRHTISVYVQTASWHWVYCTVSVRVQTAQGALCLLMCRQSQSFGHWVNCTKCTASVDVQTALHTYILYQMCWCAVSELVVYCTKCIVLMSWQPHRFGYTVLCLCADSLIYCIKCTVCWCADSFGYIYIYIFIHTHTHCTKCTVSVDLQSSHEQERVQALHQHKVERRKIRRSAGEISKTFKDKPKFWMGQRVNTK